MAESGIEGLVVVFLCFPYWILGLCRLYLQVWQWACRLHSAEICAVAAQPCTFHRVSGSKVEETFGGGSADGGLLQGVSHPRAPSAV